MLNTCSRVNSASPLRRWQPGPQKKIRNQTRRRSSRRCRRWRSGVPRFIISWRSPPPWPNNKAGAYSVCEIVARRLSSFVTRKNVANATPMVDGVGGGVTQRLRCDEPCHNYGYPAGGWSCTVSNFPCCATASWIPMTFGLGKPAHSTIARKRRNIGGVLWNRTISQAFRRLTPRLSS
jgi:hypothetical protein